jgi:hypothetical protein
MGKLKEKLSKASRLIGPEDVRAGQFVTISEWTWQVLCEDCTGEDQPRIAHVSGWPEGSGWPLRVEKVCLPFVFAQTVTGTHVTVDLRRARLSRLSKSYGRAVFEAHKKPEEPPPATT